MQIVEDIKSLNLHVLCVLRDVARQDKAIACYRFGCSETFVNMICETSFEGLKQMAEAESLLFSLKYQPDQLERIATSSPQYRGLLMEGLGHAAA